jgi:hypothetical protein
MLVSQLVPPLSAQLQKEYAPRASQPLSSCRPDHRQAHRATLSQGNYYPLLSPHRPRGIHLGSHKLHFVGHFLKKYPLAIDAVVILAMLAFGAVTEGHEGGESHEAGAVSE